MDTLDGGVGPDTDQAIRLCELLGLDPEETASIRVVIESGTGAVVEWTGRRRMSLARLTAGLSIALEPDDPPESKWQIGPDPWTPPC